MHVMCLQRIEVLIERVRATQEREVPELTRRLAAIEAFQAVGDEVGEGGLLTKGGGGKARVWSFFTSRSAPPRPDFVAARPAGEASALQGFPEAGRSRSGAARARVGLARLSLRGGALGSEAWWRAALPWSERLWAHPVPSTWCLVL